MSALAGRWNFDGRPDAVGSCARMLATQEIYGPDDAACWDGGAIALGRRLFRILPEDAHDRQPLSGGGGRYRLVADVRLDDRAALARDLGLAPAAAAGLPDAALLLGAWERWEENLFDRLFGDYAFALWDGRDRRLILARDPLGARPLHYHLGPGFAAFASMPKGLHALPEIPRAADEERVAEFLALLPEHGPRSFFAGISRVEAGQAVTIAADGAMARRQHWQPRREPLRLAKAEDYAAALRAELDRAVATRLRGEGRVGAQLSGGLDSAAVTGTAARLLAPRGAGLVAFTSVPRADYDGSAPAGRIGDESALAAATAARHANVEHVLVRPDGSSVLDQLDRNFDLFDRPVVNPCNAQWLAAINAEARRRGVRVLLTGAMGNFTISYDGRELLSELAARGRWLRLLGEGRALLGTGHGSWRSILAGAVGPWLPEPLWNAAARLSGRGADDPGAYTALNPERRRALAMDERARAQGFDLSYRPRKTGFDARLWCLRRVDPGNQNKGVLGGWGIDLRDPTGDRRLVEFCLSVPTEHYLERGRPRALLRNALADRIPAAVLAERRKGLQAVDWHESLSAGRDRLSEEIARLERVPAAAAALDLARMRKLAEDWPAEGWHSSGTTAAYRLALLRGIVNGHFLRRTSAAGGG